MPPDDLEGLADYVAGSEQWFRSKLQLLVEHRTVSPGKTTDDDILAGARAARDLIQASGASAELVDTRGTPSVLGRFTHPNPKARVVLYNHLDVQPADGQWTQADPFAFVVEPHPEREFLYRGRGSTDDKGPALCGLRAAMWIKENNLPIEVNLLWETEEEIGSPHFSDVVEARREIFGACECVIVSDTIWPSDVQPAISIGLRGSLHAVLKLRTGTKAVHSGLTGGVARNPVKELAALATAIDRAGFWREDVVPPTPEEVEGFLQSKFDVDYFRRAHALEKLETDIPLEMMLRLWTRPTFEVHGLVGGYMQPGVKTIVPDEAELKISFRMVPDQKPAKLGERLREFVRNYAPDVEVDVAGFLEPYQGSTDGRVHAAIMEAFTAATGKRPVTVREGGSIGAVPILAQRLGIPVHFLPLSLPEHGYHAPNEYFDWRQARVGIETFARTFATLATG